MALTKLDALRHIRENTVAWELLDIPTQDKINKAIGDITTLTSTVSNLEVLQNTDASTFEQLTALIASIQQTDGSQDSLIAQLVALADAASSGLNAERIRAIAVEQGLLSSVTSLTSSVDTLLLQVSGIASTVLGHTSDISDLRNIAGNLAQIIAKNAAEETAKDIQLDGRIDNLTRTIDINSQVVSQIDSKLDSLIDDSSNAGDKVLSALKVRELLNEQAQTIAGVSAQDLANFQNLVAELQSDEEAIQLLKTTLGSVVRTDTSQRFTPEQQTQALLNINGASASDLASAIVAIAKAQLAAETAQSTADDAVVRANAAQTKAEAGYALAQLAKSSADAANAAAQQALAAVQAESDVARQAESELRARLDSIKTATTVVKLLENTDGKSTEFKLPENIDISMPVSMWNGALRMWEGSDYSIDLRSNVINFNYSPDPQRDEIRFEYFPK